MSNPSHTLTLLTLIQEKLELGGARTTLWDLRKRPLPVVDVRYYGNEEECPDPLVHELVEVVKGSDGFVFGTPVYHNSYSGALKNALDNLGPAQFRRKPIGLVSNGGGMRSVQPLDHLRIVARALGAITIPTHVASTSRGDYVADPDGATGFRLVAEDVLSRIDLLVEELLWFTERLREAPS